MPSPDRKDEETVLLVHGNAKGRAGLLSYLSKDYRVLVAKTGREAWDLFKQNVVDAVLFDEGVRDTTAESFFREARVRFPDTIRMFLSDSRNDQDVMKIFKAGAVYQIVPKPCPPWHLWLLVNRALESRELARRHRFLSRELKFSDNAFRSTKDQMTRLIRNSYEFDQLVFASDAMLDMCNLVRKAAPTDLPVLIQGETGTGKELLAKAIHGFGSRQKFPFLVQNCGALPDELLQSELFGHKRGAFTGAVSDRLGLFSAADGGTVFLDEISEVSPSFQVSLLRFLQEGEIKPLGAETVRYADVRIVAASNRPLKELVDAGTFRQDLYYRLRGFEVDIPPLRERVEDIAVLAEYLSRKYAESLNRKVAGISAQVIRHLQAYGFPGNVRELETEIRRMVSLTNNGEFLSVEHLSPEIANALPVETKDAGTKESVDTNGAGTLKEKVERLEAAIVGQCLQRHRWNQSRAAKELGLSRVGLASKIKRYHLMAHEGSHG